MTATPEPTALFERSGDGTFVATEFTRGPWRPDAQHGGPPSALLAHETVNHVHADEFVSFIEVELVRPVPLASLTTRAERVRISGRVHRITAELHDGDELVARSSAVALKTEDLDPPEWEAPSTVAPDPPEAFEPADPPRWASGDVTTYHRNAVEHRFTAGSFREPGPAIDWVRLRVPVVVGAEPTSLERLCAAADFGSGISAVYGPRSAYGLINANLTISLYRHASSDWISLDATTHVGPQGCGLGVTTLGDVDGPVGIATQSLLGYRLRAEPFVTR